jgi:hypothetical protein
MLDFNKRQIIRKSEGGGGTGWTVGGHNPGGGGMGIFSLRHHFKRPIGAS